MFESLKAYPILYIALTILVYCAGGATMLAAVFHGLYLRDTKATTSPKHRQHRMEVEADRDKIGEALGVFN
jgi:hypothetical protein